MQRALETFGGAAYIALVGVGVAEADVRRHVLDVAPERAVADLDCAVVLLQLRVSGTESGEEPGIGRIGRDDGVEIGDRTLTLAAVHVELCAGDQGVGVAGPEPERLIETAHGVIERRTLGERQPLLEMQLGIARALRQRRV